MPSKLGFKHSMLHSKALGELPETRQPGYYFVHQDGTLSIQKSERCMRTCGLEEFVAAIWSKMSDQAQKQQDTLPTFGYRFVAVSYDNISIFFSKLIKFNLRKELRDRTMLHHKLKRNQTVIKDGSDAHIVFKVSLQH
ncbi:hypothetical protein DSO57_1028932 [Entomophthora muscae]|uniref:Uncharacterized protein n=1 Tax=Entomophthora muscae TaxID=34485 RepID=A0ACC2UAD7_9FUNG|nr:hypothetical protein DSO57_1028932 [Entomophthora muscae]